MREGNQNTGNIVQYSSGYIQIASGTTAQRPSVPVNGMIRYNTDVTSFEMYQGGAWLIPNFVPRTRLFYADQFDSPASSDWAANANAPATSDNSNTAITTRAFDDSLEEGIGMSMTIPTSVTNITLRLKGRAATAPSAAQGVVMKLYSRTIPNNAAIGSWSGTVLTTLSIPTNAYYQYYSFNFSLSNLNLTNGSLTQFELTRVGSATADTLTGDWYLAELGVEFY